MIDDPKYHQARKQLLSFLEGEATQAIRTLSPFETRQAAIANRTVTPEELFVIDKYTGFNRFRRKYRKQPAQAESVESLNRAEAKAL